MLFAIHLTSVVMTWLKLLPVVVQLNTSIIHSPSAEMNCLTYLICSEVNIAKRISYAGESYGISASTLCLCILLLSNINSTFHIERKLSVHCLRSISIHLTFPFLTNLLCKD